MYRNLISLTLALSISLIGCSESSDNNPDLEPDNSQIVSGVTSLSPMLPQTSATNNQNDVRELSRVLHEDIDRKRSVDNIYSFNMNGPMATGGWFVSVLEYADGSVRLVPTNVQDKNGQIALSGYADDVHGLPTSLSVYSVPESFLTPPDRSSDDSRAVRSGRTLVLVHGYFGSRASMEPMREALAPLYDNTFVFEYGFNDYVSASASRLRSAIIDRGYLKNGGRVDIVAHSLGGLVSRCAIEQQGFSTYVDTLVTAGTPHKGDAWDIAPPLSIIISLFAPSIRHLLDQGLGVFGLFIFSGAGHVSVLGDITPGGPFIQSLNQPSRVRTVYLTIGGDALYQGDGMVMAHNANWSGLKDEGSRHIYRTLPLTHTRLISDKLATITVKDLITKYGLNPHTGGDTGGGGGGGESGGGSGSSGGGGGLTTVINSGLWKPGQGGTYPERYVAEWRRLDGEAGMGKTLGPVVAHNQSAPLISKISGRPLEYQLFEKGVLVKFRSAIYGVKGGLWEIYRALGQCTGKMGAPILPQEDFVISGASGEHGHILNCEGGYVTIFRGGGGTVEHRYEFGGTWNRKGLARGEMGWPITNAEVMTGYNGDRCWVQRFEAGTVVHYFNPYSISISFNQKYWEWSGPSLLGFLVENKQMGVRSGVSGRYGEAQRFQNGAVYELGGNINIVHSKMYRTYLNTGGPNGPYGFPLQRSNGDNSEQPFEGGILRAR